jgi:hypothetical protein
MGHRCIFAIAIVLGICAFSGNTFAQPKARKFHEVLLGWGAHASSYDELRAAEAEMKFHLIRYGKQLRRENAAAYIIGYGARVIEWEFTQLPDGQFNADHMGRLLAGYTSIQRISTVDGGFREAATAELWIVRRGASLPSPTPTVSRNDVVQCPSIQVNGPRYVPAPNAPLTFTALVRSYVPTTKPSLSWEVSDGKIVSGQGTNVVSVELPENTSGRVVTKVTANGYSFACPIHTTTATFETVVRVGYFKSDEYGQISDEDEMARLDNFSTELKNQDLVAYVIYYGGRCTPSCGFDYPRCRPHYPRRGEAETRVARIKPYLMNTRGIAENRIFVINGGFRESWTAELWLVPKGAPPPPLMPTTNAKDIQYRTGKVTERELRFGCMGTKR